MEQLIIVVILFALSGLSTFIQKRRQRQEQDRVPPSPSPKSRQPQRPQAEPQPKPKMDWEEQLRRLLEGEFETPEPKPSPPPPIVEVRPIAPPPLPAKAAKPLIVYTETEEEAARAMAPLTESSQAYARASQLHEATAARLREIDARTEEHRVAPVHARARKPISPVVASALGQLHQRQSVQQAFITAVILGPPKALAKGEN